MLPHPYDLEHGEGWEIAHPWKYDLWAGYTGGGIRIAWDPHDGEFEFYTIKKNPNNNEEVLENYQGHLEPTEFINNLKMIMALVDQMEPRLAELLKQKAAEEASDG